MPFLLLLVLTLASLPGWPAPPPWVTPAGAGLLTWAGAGLLVAGAGLLAGRLCRQLEADPGHRSAVLRRYSSRRFYHALVLMAVYLASLYGLGWSEIARSLAGHGGTFPGVELLVLAPFLAALVLSWALFYEVERAAHRGAHAGETTPFPSRWAYVGVQVRHNLILVCPPLVLMVAQQGILTLFPGLSEGWMAPAVSLVLIAALFLCIPWILRLFLGLRPLPEGPLRERLLAAARRLHFRCNDILLWNTRNGIANAMVTGLLPTLRYVVVTDRLAIDLTPEEVEAVFGHEVGHVKHHHLLYYFVFLIASMVVLVGLLVATGLFGTGAAEQDVLAQLPFLAVLGAYIFVVFGFLSRRCERQADIFGCRTVSCAAACCSGHETFAAPVPLGRALCATGIQTFIGALEKVARLNGISRDRPSLLSSWQHSTIARRVEFLQRVSSDPAVEARFQRTVWLMKCGLLVGLGAVFVAVLLVLGPSGMKHLLQAL
jgi:Zn-dependent protease with chaperone function